MKKDHIGSSFEDFLREEGINEEVEAGAIKNVTVCMIEQSMIERIKWGQTPIRHAGPRSCHPVLESGPGTQ